MLFGHNTNVKAGDTTYHVQTEDRGVAHALIDTTVYFRGRVLHRRTNNYFDLLPLDADRERELKLRVDAGNVIDGAIVTAKVDGAVTPAEFSTVTGGFGNAQFEFEMPPLAHTDDALVVEGFKGSARGQLRFQLKMKPRVPSAG